MLENIFNSMEYREMTSACPTIEESEKKRKCRLGVTAAEGFVKRCLDVAMAIVGLILSSPLFLIIYIMIKLDGDGPTIFSQERLGLKGRPFMLYKFRTMRTDSEADGTPKLYCEGDKRVTKTGRFLREHHLDELPQLWNVLKGEMSFVGYRPERKYFVDKIMEANPDYSLLYKMRPGLFSPATLYNGYTDTLEKMLRRLSMDLEYMKEWSLWLDFKIICLTVASIIGGKKF